MLEYMKVVTMVLALVPQILAIMKAVETPGNGAEKAATVTQLVLAGFDLVPEETKKQIKLDRVEAFVSKVITIAVSFLNKIGAFSKSN